MEHNFDNATSGIFLNFEGSRKVHPALVCNRAGPAIIVDELGRNITVPAGVPRIYRENVDGRHGLRTDSSATNLFLYSQSLNHDHWRTYSTNLATVRDVTRGPNAKPMIGLYENGEFLTPFVRRHFSNTMGGGVDYSVQCVIAPGGRRFVSVVTVIITIINGTRVEVVSSLRLDTQTAEHAVGYSVIENSAWRVTKRGDGMIWVGFSGTTPASGSVEDSYIDIRPTTATSLETTAGAGQPYQTSAEVNPFSVSDMQLEINRTPTAYIPTVAAQQSRVAEHFLLAEDYFNRIYNHDEGTVFCDVSGNGVVAWQLGIGTPTRIFLEFTKNDGREGRLMVNNNGTLFGANSPNIRGRTAFTYKNGYFRFVDADGVLYTGGNGTPHAKPDTLRLGTSGSHQFNTNGPIYKLAYYPKSCSDEAMLAWVRA